jgi:hypothetical protein
MLSEHCTTCMGGRHVMSSERISYTVTQTLHLLSTQAFCDLRGAAVLPHLVGYGHGGPSLRRSPHPQPTPHFVRPQTCLVGRVNAVVPDPHLG